MASRDRGPGRAPSGLDPAKWASQVSETDPTTALLIDGEPYLQQRRDAEARLRRRGTDPDAFIARLQISTDRQEVEERRFRTSLEAERRQAEWDAFLKTDEGRRWQATRAAEVERQRREAEVERRRQAVEAEQRRRAAEAEARRRADAHHQQRIAAEQHRQRLEVAVQNCAAITVLWHNGTMTPELREVTQMIEFAYSTIPRAMWHTHWVILRLTEVRARLEPTPVGDW